MRRNVITVAQSQMDQALDDCVEPCGPLPVTLTITRQGRKGPLPRAFALTLSLCHPHDSMAGTADFFRAGRLTNHRCRIRQPA
jgi:hypothetical protein